MRRAAIGISAHLGWAATTTITVGKSGVRVLRTDRLETDPGYIRLMELCVVKTAMLTQCNN